jgi:hypothetical protein
VKDSGRRFAEFIRTRELAERDPEDDSAG